MISFIVGEILSVTNRDDLMVVDILAGNVGYRLTMLPANVLVGEESRLYVYTKYREDSVEMYGFIGSHEREIFEVLISVSGLGPKGAMALLNSYQIDEIKAIISEGDFKPLTKAKGVGPKLAKKIVLELSGVLTLEEKADVSVDNQQLVDLIEAMKSLGYKGEDLKKIRERAQELIDEGPHTLEELIGKVLRNQ